MDARIEEMSGMRRDEMKWYILGSNFDGMDEYTKVLSQRIWIYIPFFELLDLFSMHFVGFNYVWKSGNMLGGYMVLSGAASAIFIYLIKFISSRIDSLDGVSWVL